jgi:hypothetical protein
LFRSPPRRRCAMRATQRSLPPAPSSRAPYRSAISAGIGSVADLLFLAFGWLLIGNGVVERVVAG